MPKKPPATPSYSHFRETDALPDDDRGYVDQRRGDLSDIRRHIGNLVLLIDQLPKYHDGELPDDIHGTTCSLLDSLRCYRDAPRHFGGEAARLARVRRAVAHAAKSELDS